MSVSAIGSSAAANIAQVVVGVVVLLGGAKSAYNGVLRKSYRRLKLIETLDERTAYIEGRQEEMVDALVALSHVQENDDVRVDPHEVRQSFDRVDRSQDFIDRDRPGYRRPDDDTDDTATDGGTQSVRSDFIKKHHEPTDESD